MLADVRDGGKLSVVFENRHALTRKTDDTRAVFGNVCDAAGVNKAVTSGSGLHANQSKSDREHQPQARYSPSRDSTEGFYVVETVGS